MTPTSRAFLWPVTLKNWMLGATRPELRKQGMNDQQIFEEREKEVKAGTLQMPKQPAAMFVYSADEKMLTPQPAK